MLNELTCLKEKVSIHESSWIGERTLKKTTIILLAVVLAASGCISNTKDQSPQETSESGNDAVTTFTSENENSTITLKTNNDTRTFEFTYKQRYDVSSSESMSKYQIARFSAGLGCTLSQQVAYNYSNLKENIGDYELKDNQFTAIIRGEESAIPIWPFKKFEAEKAEFELVDKEGSDLVASCQPTEEELNLEMNIESNSENPGNLS